MLAPRMAAGLAGAILISLAGVGPTVAAGQCPALPNVSWWDSDPDKIVAYVDRTFQGNWDPYIRKWENYRLKMAQIYGENGAAVVKSRNLRLEGDALAEHIRDIDQRLRVTRCLREKFGGKVAAKPAAAPI